MTPLKITLFAVTLLSPLISSQFHKFGFNHVSDVIYYGSFVVFGVLMLTERWGRRVLLFMVTFPFMFGRNYNDATEGEKLLHWL